MPFIRIQARKVESDTWKLRMVNPELVEAIYMPEKGKSPLVQLASGDTFLVPIADAEAIELALDPVVEVEEE